MKEVKLWYSQAKQISKILSRIFWENEASVNKWKKQNPSLRKGINSFISMHNLGNDKFALERDHIYVPTFINLISKSLTQSYSRLLFVFFMHWLRNIRLSGNLPYCCKIFRINLMYRPNLLTRSMTLQKELAIAPGQPPVIDQELSTLSLSHQLEFSQSVQNWKWYFLFFIKYIFQS